VHRFRALEARDHGGAYDDQVEYRVQRHWELREFTGLPLAAAAGDQDEVNECIAKLRAGPILSPQSDGTLGSGG
jgi:hypothetical protein